MLEFYKYGMSEKFIADSNNSVFNYSKSEYSTEDILENSEVTEHISVAESLVDSFYFEYGVNIDRQQLKDFSCITTLDNETITPTDDDLQKIMVAVTAMGRSNFLQKINPKYTYGKLEVSLPQPFPSIKFSVRELFHPDALIENEVVFEGFPEYYSTFKQLINLGMDFVDCYNKSMMMNIESMAMAQGKAKSFQTILRAVEFHQPPFEFNADLKLYTILTQLLFLKHEDNVHIKFICSPSEFGRYNKALLILEKIVEVVKKIKYFQKDINHDIKFGHLVALERLCERFTTFYEVSSSVRDINVRVHRLAVSCGDANYSYIGNSQSYRTSLDSV